MGHVVFPLGLGQSIRQRRLQAHKQHTGGEGDACSDIVENFGIIHLSYKKGDRRKKKRYFNSCQKHHVGTIRRGQRQTASASYSNYSLLCNTFFEASWTSFNKEPRRKSETERGPWNKRQQRAAQRLLFPADHKNNKKQYTKELLRSMWLQLSHCGIHTHKHTHTPQSTSVTVGLPVRSGEGLRVGGAEHLFPRTTRRSTSLISMTTEMLRQQISSEQKKLSQGKLIKENRSQTTEVVWS